MSGDELHPEDHEDGQEPLPPRRRVRLSYNSAGRTMMADQIMIVMALVVALFMVYSRGCRSSIEGLGKVLTETPRESPDAGAREP